MTPDGSADATFRIYIQDDGTKHYLRDWITSDHRDHLIFDTDRRYAMRFKKLYVAKWYRKKMIAMGYNPIIE